MILEILEILSIRIQLTGCNSEGHRPGDFDVAGIDGIKSLSAEGISPAIVDPHICPALTIVTGTWHFVAAVSSICSATCFDSA